MKRLLIATIMRNARPHVETWLTQLTQLWEILVNAGYEVECSVAENDSVDGTDQWLRSDALRSMPPFKWHISTDKLGTQQYGSVWSLDRLRNLARARQQCLIQAGDLSRFSKVAYLEVDVTYSPEWCAELILARHPLAAGLGEPDIYSGWSLRSEHNPKESVFLYDTCATRATCYDTSWDISEANGTWRGKTVIPTDLGGPDAMCLHAVWSTFNCFCVYNARPFIEGAKWDWVNHRLNTGQGRVLGREDHEGFLEADTAALCETFRAHGYDNVLLNTNCLIRHA